jgi:hypothetical protein
MENFGENKQLWKTDITQKNKNVTNATGRRCKKLRINKKQQAKNVIVNDSWGERDWHEVATSLCRMDDGIPRKLDKNRINRLKALGNAIVPQIAYIIFEAIKNFEEGRRKNEF